MKKIYIKFDTVTIFKRSLIFMYVDLYEFIPVLHVLQNTINGVSYNT